MRKKQPSIIFPKPVRADNKHQNEHCYHVATSQGGKTSAVKQLPRIKATDQVLFFDPYGDYTEPFKGKQVETYNKIGDFYRAAAQARKKSTGFKIAFSPDLPKKADFDNFCGVVWSLGDGKHKKKLHVVLEEVAQFADSAAKADGYFGNLLSVGRKFGIVVTTLFQRGQEVPKTVLSNSPYKWVGLQERPEDSIYLSKATGIPVNDIDSLVQYEYIYKMPGHRDNFVKAKLKKYK